MSPSMRERWRCGDLAERLATVTLAGIREDTRRTEQELAALWDVTYPSLFGALLDLAAAVSVRLPDVRLGESPRMADFARVLPAVDHVCGTDGLSRFTSKARGVAQDSLDADPFLTALRSRLERTFQGTAVELLTQVTPGDEMWRPPREWPKNSRQVTTLLRRNAPALRHAGWTIEDLGADNKQHATVWQISAPASGEPSR